jgi:hypothetical protein
MMETPAAASSAPAVPGGNDDKLPWEYSLRKYLLLLATLVATVAYSAGFSPPGGVWQETGEDRHLAGDPILLETSGTRFVAFFYLNAGAFASSLVVIVLILILSVRHELTRSDKRRWLAPLHVLRGFMVLDLLSLIGAYTAGIYRDRDVPVYTMILAALTVVYLVVFHMVLSRSPQQQDHGIGGEEVQTTPGELRKEREKPRKVLMLLATFAASVTYLAGLNAPGGFWNDAKEGHQPGEPILMGGSHETRLKVFVNLNSTAFFWSLLITVQLLDKNLSLHDKKVFRFRLLFASIVFALLGLVGAYVAGSCRETNTTVYVTLLGAALPACAILLLRLIHRCRPAEKHGQDEAATTSTTNGGGININRYVYIQIKFDLYMLRSGPSFGIIPGNLLVFYVIITH